MPVKEETKSKNILSYISFYCVFCLFYIQMTDFHVSMDSKTKSQTAKII